VYFLGACRTSQANEEVPRAKVMGGWGEVDKDSGAVRMGDGQGGWGRKAYQVWGSPHTFGFEPPLAATRAHCATAVILHTHTRITLAVGWSPHLPWSPFMRLRERFIKSYSQYRISSTWCGGFVAE